jgi:glycosyltransferase involved in cell wall biosynthesis
VFYIFISDKNESGITTEGVKFISVKRKHDFGNRWVNWFARILLPGSVYTDMLQKASEIKADVYHIHDLKVNRIGIKLKKLPHQPKIVYDVHEPYPENIIDYFHTRGIFTLLKKLHSEYIRYWEKSRAKQYDLIITTEENLRDRFQQFLPQDKVAIIYNYTDLTDDLRSDSEKKYDFIYCGGVTKLRGALQIIEAARIALKEIKDLKIIFLGSVFPPELKPDLQEIIYRYKLGDHIELHEPVPYKDVAGFYKQSKIGLGIFLPIQTHRIILQIKIFEYMMFGLPIIGSNFGHISDYIHQDKAGITVDPENTEAIAGAMIRLLKDKSLYEDLSNNARRACEQKYTWKIMEQKLIMLYSGLINK